MATKMLVCPECDSAVAPGRFACTSCGALLASVASAPRSLSLTEAMTPPSVSPAAPPAEIVDAESDTGFAPDPHEAVDGLSTIGPAWAHGPLERAPGESDLELGFDEDAPLAAAGATTAAPAPEADMEAPAAVAAAEPAPQNELIAEAQPAEAPPAAPDVDSDAVADVAGNEAQTAADDEPVTDEADVAGDEVEAADVDVEAEGDEFEADEPAAPAAAALAVPAPVPAPAAMNVVEPQWPETRGWPPPGAAQPMSMQEPVQRPRAGAYLPPSALLTSVADLSEELHAGAPAVAATAAPAAAAPYVAGHDTPPTEAAKDARRMPGIDQAFPPQLVVAGAGITTLGFLLPWAAIVIGSGRIGGYLEQWGLAGPGHVLILLVVIALGAVASQVDRLPGWARPGLASLVLAGLLVGLVWPYLLGGFQPAIGVYVTLAGALVMSLGGSLDLWLRRHAGVPRPV
jgi:hypothetical protein